MTELLKTVLSLSLSGTILILLLLLLRPLYRERLSMRWQYYIWLLVIARLLLPVTPQTSLVGVIFRQAEHSIEHRMKDMARQNTQENENVSTLDSLADDTDDTDAVLSAPGQLQTGSAGCSAQESQSVEPLNNASAQSQADKPLTNGSAQSQTEEPQSNANSTETALSNSRAEAITTGTAATQSTVRTILTIWLGVALLLLVRKVTIYQSFVKYMRAGSHPVEDMELLERFGRIVEAQRISRPIELYTNNLAASPLLIGFVRPRIILPNAGLSADDFYHTILHELTHYKRRDMFYKWLVQLAVCLHWFNPLMRLMEHEIARLCELSCDERVIDIIGDNAKKSYGDTLLHAIGTGGSYKDSLASVTLGESKELLKGRLDAIMKHQKKSKTIQIATLSATFALICFVAAVGAYAAPAAETTAVNKTATIVETTSVDEVTAADNTSSAAPNTAANSSAYTFHSQDYAILYEDGTYYILCDGATIADRPISAVTDGCFKLTLVRPDSYSSLGPFDSINTLVDEVTALCRSMVEKDHMTQDDMNLLVKAAEEIQRSPQLSQNPADGRAPADRTTSANGTASANKTMPAGEAAISEDSAARESYISYAQSAYYLNPYIFELGWNIPARQRTAYSSTRITLSDDSVLPVAFDFSCEKSMDDADAMSALTKLFDRLVSQEAGSSRPIEHPFVVSIDYVGDADVYALAEKYYGKGKGDDVGHLTYFYAVFKELDQDTRIQYMDRAYADERISFFACCIDDVCDGSAPDSDIYDRYLQKAYQDDQIAFWAVMSDSIDDGARRRWLTKCIDDENINFASVLDEDDLLEELIEESGNGSAKNRLRNYLYGDPLEYDSDQWDDSDAWNDPDGWEDFDEWNDPNGWDDFDGWNAPDKSRDEDYDETSGKAAARMSPSLPICV